VSSQTPVFSWEKSDRITLRSAAFHGVSSRLPGFNPTVHTESPFIPGLLQYNQTFFAAVSGEASFNDILLSMQQVSMIHDIATGVSDHGFVYRDDVGNYRNYPLLLHAVISARAHAAAEQRLAVLNCHRHAIVPVLGCRAESMRLPRDFWVVQLTREMGMTEFLPQLAGGYFAIHDCSYQVVGSSAKVLADGFAIIGDCGDFHVSFPHK
jgi:hypothetical protein